MTRRCILAFFQEKKERNISYSYLICMSKCLFFNRDAVHKRTVIAVQICKLELVTELSNYTVPSGNRGVPEGDCVDRLPPDCFLFGGEREGRAFLRAVYRNQPRIHMQNIYLSLTGTRARTGSKLSELIPLLSLLISKSQPCHPTKSLSPTRIFAINFACSAA